MNQFLNNINIIDIIYFFATFIEHYLFMALFLLIFDVKASHKQQITYLTLILIISVITSSFIPSPFNIILNYICIIVMIASIFKLSLLKSITSLIIPSFVFSLLNVLFQKPYLSILNISPEEFIDMPKYRIPYLILLYSSMSGILVFLTKFKKLNFSLEFLDSLDKKTRTILCVNIILGFLTLCIQLIITAFYIDIVPIYMSILNFILLISFLLLSIYSFTRIIKLANTKKDLQSAEEYNKSLEILYDSVKGFKHDFDNIVSTLNGFIENNDMTGLKNYFDGVKKECKITNNLSIINPRIINNPGLYSLLNNKYFQATNLGINFEFEYFLDLNNVHINLYEFSRIIGILIDNAIEEAIKCNDKVVKVSFIRETRNNRALITIQNTYSNKDVDIEKIFNKGASGKENHSGIGLWEVKNYVKNSKNLDLFTSKTNQFFKQELSIYDL